MRLLHARLIMMLTKSLDEHSDPDDENDQAASSARATVGALREGLAHNEQLAESWIDPDGRNDRFSRRRPYGPCLVHRSEQAPERRRAPEPASRAQEYRQSSGDPVPPLAQPSAGRQRLARSRPQDPRDPG